MKRFFQNGIITTIISSMIITSCVMDLDISKVPTDVQLSGSLVMPVGESKVTVNQLLSNIGAGDIFTKNGTNISINSEANMEYPYRTIQILEFSKETQTPLLPSTALGNLPMFILAPNTSIPRITKADTIDLGLNSDPTKVSISKVEISSATLSLTVNAAAELLSIPATNLSFVVSFPDNNLVKKDGSPYSISFTPDSYGVAKNILLTDFNILTPNNVQGIPMSIDIDAKSGNTAVNVAKSSAITTKIEFKQLNYTVAWGKFQPAAGSKNSAIVPIDLPASLSGLNLKFSNPKATITVNNNIGAKLTFNINYVHALGATNNVLAKASFAGSDSIKYIINKPLTPGDSALTSIVLDKDSGATDKLFGANELPKSLKYEFAAGINNDAALNFITPSAKLKANIKISLPFQLNAGSSIQYVDTMPNFGSSLNTTLQNTTLDKAILVLTITNGLPLATVFEFLDMTDALGNPLLQSNFTKKYDIEPPVVDATGLIKTTHAQQLQIELTTAQWEDFKKVKDLKFKVTLNTANNGTNPVSLNTTDEFNVKFGVYAKGSTIINLGKK